MLYKGCFIFVLLVLLTLFKEVKLEDIDGGYTEWSGWSRCNAVCDGFGRKRQSRTCTNPKPEGNGKTCEEQGLGPAERYKKCTDNCDALIFFAYWPYIVPALIVFCLVVFKCCFIYDRNRQNKRETRARLLVLSDLAEGELPPRYPESREPQLNSARRAPLQGTCVPYTRGCQAPAGNQLEVLMVELPPLSSGEQPPPPYSGERLPPHYSGEQSPPPYREEQPPPPYSGVTATNSREELPPPYPEEEHVHEYAVTSFV